MKTVMYEIVKRKASRAFSGERATENQIRRILAAAHLAPSCFNNQPWQFVVYRSDEELASVHDALDKGNHWARKSAFIVAVVTDPDDDCRLNDRRDYALFDTGMAVENMMLQAVHEGLLAHPMAGFDPSLVKEISQIPESSIVIALVAFGVPGKVEDLDEKFQQMEAAARDRKPLDMMVHYGKW
jgi:nitroreductase